MVRIVDCPYRILEATERAEDPKKYQKSQNLAEVKIKAAFTKNENLKKAISIVEEYVFCGGSAEISKLMNLAEKAENSTERQLFNELMAIVY